MDNAIKLTSVTKTFIDGKRQLVAVSDITLEINQGEFFIFVGPSGCGKSTVLRIMSGLEKKFTGNVELGVGMTRQDTSFVFQQFALLPWLTVYQNVELGLIARKIDRETRKKQVFAELELLGLSKFAHVRPHELSGGMRQRVGIARALVTNPKIIFLDEPFSELDSFTAEELRKELLMIWQERKLTIVMVTHIIEEALELADRIAVMTPRPGKIEKIVENKLSRPRQKRVGAFYKMVDELYQLIRP